MFSLILSVWLRRSKPRTRAVPDAGRRIPHRSRMVVVLPAPSGPTRPNISPWRTLKSRPRTASTSSKVFLRPLAEMANSGMEASLLGRRERSDHGIGRQSGLEQAVLIGQLDLDAEHQLDPVLARLHVLRRELRLGRNVGDRSGERPVGESVDRNLGPVAQLDPARLQIGRAHV